MTCYHDPPRLKTRVFMIVLNGLAAAACFGVAYLLLKWR